jgi:hypothetical protein
MLSRNEAEQQRNRLTSSISARCNGVSTMIPQHDVFVSYKIRRNSHEAKRLVALLRRRGVQVWFDIDQLSKKEGQRKDKDELIETLTSAAKAARLSVVFEAQLEAVLLPPGLTREEALASRLCMDDNGCLIDWNWQKLEIESSNIFVAIHPRFYVLSSGSSHYYHSESTMLFEVAQFVLSMLPDQEISVWADRLLQQHGLTLPNIYELSLEERTRILAGIDMDALGERELLCYFGHSEEEINGMAAQERVARIESARAVERARQEASEREEQLRASRGRLIGICILVIISVAIAFAIFWR